MHTLAPVGADFRLGDVDPDATPGVRSRSATERDADRSAPRLAALQERLYAAGKGGAPDAVLLVLQAMDTAGKGGIVRHVVGRLDPQGVHLHAFKAPTAEERAHDFLWRIRPQLPEAGMVGVFDRSHYEDVLIARVHGLATPDVIESRYGAIVEFERETVASGVRIIKVMLHISHEEQGERLLRRIDRPDKRWKYNPQDVAERALWADYMAAYETAIQRTSTPDAPWYVVPANHRWYARWRCRASCSRRSSGWGRSGPRCRSIQRWSGRGCARPESSSKLLPIRPCGMRGPAGRSTPRPRRTRRR